MAFIQRGSERGSRDVGTLANAGYRNGRGSAMRYGSRIGRWEVWYF